jgi:hypothetical protein
MAPLEKVRRDGFQSRCTAATAAAKAKPRDGVWCRRRERGTIDAGLGRCGADPISPIKSW